MIASTTIWLLLSIGPVTGAQRIVSIEKFVSTKDCTQAKVQMEKVIARDTGTLKDIVLSCTALTGVVPK